jgi:hypothetical protein
MSVRSWWTNLRCVHCGRPVKVTAADATFHRNLGGKPWAEHHACKEARAA